METISDSGPLSIRPELVKDAASKIKELALQKIEGQLPAELHAKVRSITFPFTANDGYPSSLTLDLERFGLYAKSGLITLQEEGASTEQSQLVVTVAREALEDRAHFSVRPNGYVDLPTGANEFTQAAANDFGSYPVLIEHAMNGADAKDPTVTLAI